PSDTIHFPATIAFEDSGEFGSFSSSHDETLRGWVDKEIKDIIADVDAAVGGGYQLVFDELNPVYINHPEGMLSTNVTIAHNDTDKIRRGIQTKRENNIKSLSLNAKTYNVSQVILNQSGLFGLSGVLGMTKLRKLPWSGYPDGLNASNSILVVPGNDAQSVSLENIDFDGNMINQFLLSDSNNRFIDFGNNSTDVTIHNCKIDNIIGDGVYASLPLRFKLSLSTISNSATTDRHDFFPLIIDSGVNTLVNGNVIQNFTTGIDATVTTESVIANNVIKNVGNGLDIYGSTFMVSSPNVLMGPANEFLSTPDVLNSEYDVINLLRSRISLGAGFYDSDSYVYQEGATPSVYDLTQNSISDNDYGEVIYRVDAILVDSDGDHSPYGRNIGPSHKDASGNAFTHDYFQTNKVYQIVEVGDTDWTIWGACVNKVGTRFVYNGHTNNSDLGTTGAVSAREFAGYNDGSSLHPPLTFTDVSEPAVDKSIGEFKFRIGDDSGSGNPHTTWSDLTSGAYTSTALKNNYLNHVKTALDDSTADHVHPFKTKHFGLQWSASYRYYVRAGEIQENQVVGGIAVNNGEWTQTGRYDANGKFGGVNINGGTENDSLNANRYFADFTVTIDKLDYVQTGDHVIFQRGSTFNPYIGDGNIVNNQYNGFVVVKTPQAGLTTTAITIRYYGDTANAPDLTVLNSAVGVNSTETGTLNILDDFVMAQGLIK
ncbi:hypothetical protein OAG36_00800, partial [bacterium]|nr:hypothetical protein [bacterium]